MKELAMRLENLAHLAGNLDTQDSFNQEYETLLTEVTQALRSMRAMAVCQSAYLWQQVGKSSRMN